MKNCGCAVGIAIGLVLALMFIGLTAPVEAAFFLAVGWVFFLAKVLPQMTVSWPSVATAIVALGVFIAGFHRLATWWSAATPVIDGAPAPQSAWQWRWTLSAAAAVILSFAAGIAIVGASHQFVWMATSDQPLAENSWKDLHGRMEGRNKLQQIGISLHDYETANGRFPAGGAFDPRGRPLFGWQTALLPYVDQQALFDRINLELPWDAPENAAALAVVVPAFINERIQPDARTDAAGRALTHYAGNGLVLNAGPGMPLSQIKDGTSNTLLAGEALAQFKPWGHPVNWRDARLGINQSPEGFGAPWKGGANFLMADGSARFVSDSIDLKVLEAVATPDGGEPVGDF